MSNDRYSQLERSFDRSARAGRVGRRIWLPMIFPRSILVSNRTSRMERRSLDDIEEASRMSSIQSWASTWSILGWSTVCTSRTTSP